MPLNMVVDQNIAGAEQYLQSQGVVQRVDGRALCSADLQRAQVLLVRSVTRVDEALLAGTSVRFVGTATSGVDHIDRDYLQANDIGFAYAPGANANSVVEYVLCAIAAVDQKLEQLFAGGTVGIIGYGHIGCLLARKLDALGIACKVYDPWLNRADVAHHSSLPETLACDVVSIHAELTHAQPWPSFHMLGYEELRQMGPDALLINASRGAVIDSDALYRLLRDGQAPHCVLDVWEGEPRVNQALLSLVRFGSAHIAGYSADGKYLATRMLRSAMMAHFGQAGDAGAESEWGERKRLSLSRQVIQSDSACLRALLQQSYDLARDDQLLRASVLDETNAGANFDQLRKQYRVRREIFGSQVSVATKENRIMRIIAAMGCRVQGINKEFSQ